jgi:putative peptidoglycan lipid II flippase
MVLGTQAGVLLFNYGATTRAEAQLTGAVASVLALGLLPFTLYYIVLRGWYALELTRTAFWVTVVLNALYLALAWPLFQWAVRSDHGSLALLALAAGYVGSYWITLVLGWIVLSRRIGGLQTAQTLRALIRMGLAGVGTFAVMRLLQWLVSGLLTDPGRVTALLDIALVGTVGLLTYLGLARLMRVSEVTEVLGMLRRRLPGGR